jgi:hypothetical protein
MLFQNAWKSVLDGSKTQTRRPAQSSDQAVLDEDGNIIKVTRTGENGPPKVLFEVGQSYAVQPGPAKKTVGRIKITAIRRERLQDISQADALQEQPVTPPDATLALQTFKTAWDKSHQPGQQWTDNPEVWVIEFQLPFN